MVAVCEEGDQVAEHVRGGWEAVEEQHHRSVGGAGLAVEDPDPVHRRGAVVDGLRHGIGGLCERRYRQRGRRQKSRDNGDWREPQTNAVHGVSLVGTRRDRDESNLRFQIASLRHALEDHRDFIKTISGRGYFFVDDRLPDDATGSMTR
jgi:hypothetical protein